MKSLLLFLMLGITGFAVNAEPAEHRPADESYIEPELKIVFPAKAGVFRKQEIIRSFNPMIGTTIRYSNLKGDCADVYLYTSPDGVKEISNEVLNTHFRELIAAILHLPEKGIAVKEVKLIEQKKLLDKKNHPFGCSAEFQIIWEDGSAQTSILQLAAYQKKIIKLRMTCSKVHAETFSKVIWKAFSFAL